MALRQPIAVEEPEDLFNIACCRDPRRRTHAELPAYERTPKSA